MSHDFKPKDYPSLKAVVHKSVLHAPNGLDTHDIAPLAGYAGSRLSAYTVMMAELTQEGRKCDLNRLLPFMDATDCDAPLHFLARHRDGVFVRVPRPASGPGSLVDRLAASIREFGEYAAETATNISDGNIPARQLGRIEKEGFEAMAAIMGMIELARETHEHQYGGGK